MALMMERCEENMVVSMGSQKAVPAPFLTKTYQLVDDPLTDHIVSWGEDETTFVVWRPPEFSTHLLPNYFKHSNFSSFVRQLNTYGFKKIVADRWEFANDNFRKGEKHLLCEIHRRKTTSQHHHEISIGAGGCWPIGGSLSPSPSPESKSDILSVLTEDNQRLRRKNLMLLSEVAHMKNLYNDIVYFIQNHVKAVPPSDRQIRTSIGHNAAPRNLVVRDDQPPQTVKLFGVSLNGKKRLHTGRD